MTKAEQMKSIAQIVECAIHGHSTHTNRHHIRIEYDCPTYATIGYYNVWDRQCHHIQPGDEYFIIYEDNSSDPAAILYAVNVTADSALTAMSELVDLVARKF